MPSIYTIPSFSSTSCYRIVSASGHDVRMAVHDAQEAFQSGVWSRAPAIERSAVLSNLARDLQQRIPEIAKIESMQTGRTIREMTAQLGRLPEWLSVHPFVFI